MSAKITESTKRRLIVAYPTISGMDADFLAWHATPEERDEAWQRIVANRHMRAVIEATHPGVLRSGEDKK